MLGAVRLAVAGHESPWYPSFYPQEIRIETVEPPAAASLLQKNSLHAYVGADPFGGRTLPASVATLDSLGSYLIVSFNPASAALRSAQSRCAAGRRLLASLAELKEDITFHPYPVTPYHADYLGHFDLAQAWRQPALDAATKGKSAGDPALKIKAPGKLAEVLARAGWVLADAGWDAALEELDLPALLGSANVSLNGWLGPPWLKEGWYHAYLLLAGRLQDPSRRQRAEAIYQRLTGGAPDGAADRLNLQRTLLSLLTEGCERVVLGYGVRRAYANDDFSEGIENAVQDSHAGVVSPIFIRTVKLKDFPWNGWLRIGVEAKPRAAWNPIGGFSDPFGRLLWAAVGDPALLPAPAGGSWVANRVTATTPPGGAPNAKAGIPPDALLPEPGTGVFRPVGPGKTARAKIFYKIPLSAFQDGTRMTAADLLYPYAFAARWGARPEEDAKAYDPWVAEATAVLRKGLAGFKLVRVEMAVKNLSDLKLEWEIPVIEVYLHHAAADPQQAAAVAPPWTSLPWTLLVLMEEAVARGLAALSPEEAKRRGVPWLDLVRDPALHGRLASLAEELERTAFVPPPLKGLVTPEEAKERWASLRRFAQKHRHFLVSNGPYLLEKWSPNAVVLQVFRDLSYPLGVGTFDVYAHPPRASIAKAEVRGGRLHVAADIEKAVRAQRSYRWVREPLKKDTESGGYPMQAVGSFVALGSDGKVRAAGAARFGDDATFTADLRSLKPGHYSILVAVYLNGNQVKPDVRSIPHRGGR